MVCFPSLKIHYDELVRYKAMKLAFEASKKYPYIRRHLE